MVNTKRMNVTFLSLLKYLFTVTVVLFLSLHQTYSFGETNTTDLSYLKEWKGKYPTPNPPVAGKDFYDDKNVLSSLSHTLPPAVLKDVIRGGLVGPIQVTDNILVHNIDHLQGNAGNRITIYIDLKTGTSQAAHEHWDAKKHRSFIFWYYPEHHSKEIDQNENISPWSTIYEVDQGLKLYNKYRVNLNDTDKQNAIKSNNSDTNPMNTKKQDQSATAATGNNRQTNSNIINRNDKIDTANTTLQKDSNAPGPLTGEYRGFITQSLKSGGKLPTLMCQVIISKKQGECKIFIKTAANNQTTTKYLLGEYTPDSFKGSTKCLSTNDCSPDTVSIKFRTDGTYMEWHQDNGNSTGSGVLYKQ